MKIPNAEHECLPWRIHDIVPDFTLEDVWALPTKGGPDDLQALLALAGSFDPSQVESAPTRFLWNFRDLLGRWFGLGEISAPVDGESAAGESIPGTTETSLRDRLPPDLRGTAAHGVAHLGWVEVGDGLYEGRMAVYVKPRGFFGRAYMALIKPFRYWIVYPALTRHIERMWVARAG